MPVLDDDITRTGWMWVFVTEDALLFTHSPSRGESVPERVLGSTTGTLTVDGYTAYSGVTSDLGRERSGCWSDARQGRYDTLDYDEAFRKPVLDDIGELFDIEGLTATDLLPWRWKHPRGDTVRSYDDTRSLFARAGRRGDGGEADRVPSISRASAARRAWSVACKSSMTWGGDTHTPAFLWWSSRTFPIGWAFQSPFGSRCTKTFWSR